MARKDKAATAAYGKKWRKAHPRVWAQLKPEARQKEIARAKARVWKSRGKIIPQPCAICGGPAQMHHADYSKPAEVAWFCRAHHKDLHPGPWAPL